MKRTNFNMVSALIPKGAIDEHNSDDDYLVVLILLHIKNPIKSKLIIYAASAISTIIYSSFLTNKLFQRFVMQNNRSYNSGILFA